MDDKIQTKEKNHKAVYGTLSKIKLKVKKVGYYNYAPWTECWDEVMKAYPLSTFKVYETETGFPATIHKLFGGFVKVGVTIEGVERIEIYPITNNRNLPMKSERYEHFTYDKFGTIKSKSWVEPIDSFAINTSIKRAMVKCLAYFGLGLYIYAGEDLPEED